MTKEFAQRLLRLIYGHYGMQKLLELMIANCDLQFDYEKTLAENLQKTLDDYNNRYGDRPSRKDNGP